MSIMEDLDNYVKPENSIFSKMVQIGIIVRDLDKTVDLLNRATGWKLHHIFYTPDDENKWYKGEYEDFCCKMAFIEFAHMEIELIQPLRGRSVWSDFLEARGEGLHHMLFQVKNFEQAREALESQGIKMVQKGPSARFPGANWAYFDATEQLGYYLEIYNPDEFGYTANENCD